MKRISTLLLLIISSSLYSQTGLIASYPFNSNANDVSGFGNNGIVNGATLTNDRFGNPNSAYLFNGINNYINIGQGYSYTSHSFSCWARRDSIASNVVISKINNGPFDTQNSELGINGFIIGNGSVWQSVGSTSTTADFSQWTHIVGTYNSLNQKLKIYVNGFVDSTTVSGYSDVTTTDIYIGARPYWSGTSSTTFYFKGAIDDINIYNTTISQQTVDSLYNFNPTTSINTSIQKSQIIIYPNPTNSTFSLSGIDKNNFEYIEVTDLIGRLLLRTNSFSNIDLSGFEKGVYIYKVLGVNSYTGKVLKD